MYQVMFVGAGGESLIMLRKTEVSISIEDCQVPFDAYMSKNLTKLCILGWDVCRNDSA